MATQRIPEYYDPLVALLAAATEGAASIGTAVGLKQNDEASLRAALEALVGKPAGPGDVPPAEPGLKARWNVAKADRAAKSTVFVARKGDGRTLATTCVNVLKPRLGNRWNNAWQVAGFTNGSLAMPDNPQVLLQQFRAYFEANPAHEVPAIGATAAACHTAAKAIADASTASNASHTAASTAKTQLANGIKAARRRLIGLRAELAGLIDLDDERWPTFGFKRPGAAQAPEAPENLIATPSAFRRGSMDLNWDGSRRADGYRAKVTASATGETVAEQRVSDTDARFDDLPVGVPLAVTVTALNSAGESQPSPPVAITLAAGNASEDDDGPADDERSTDFLSTPGRDAGGAMERRAMPAISPP